MIKFIKNQFQKKYFAAALFFAGLFVVIFAIDAIYAWNSPTASPPNQAGQALNISASGNIGIGTTTPAAKLEIVGGITKTTGGLIIETRTSDPVSPETGRMWLRTDL